MERTLKYVPPAPRLQVIDLGAGDQDRFAPPKASVFFSPDGKRVYGVQPRPACRVLRYAAEAATDAANQDAEARQTARPSGRRHDASVVYLEGLRRAEEEVELKTAPRPASPARGLFKAKLGGSEGVAACLVWHPDLERRGLAWSEGDDTDGEVGASPRSPSRSGTPARPSTAPPAASLSPTGLDLWRPVTCAVASPRFRARAAFEQRRVASPDIDAIKKRGYLARHQQLRRAQATKEARETELLRTWPHGLPRNELRRAHASGLRVPGLGMCGNPLSLPRRQYSAIYAGGWRRY